MKQKENKQTKQMRIIFLEREYRQNIPRCADVDPWPFYLFYTNYANKKLTMFKEKACSLAELSYILFSDYVLKLQFIFQFFENKDEQKLS